MILDPKKIIPLLGIEHGMTVLDIGSSVGFWTKPLTERVGTAGTIIALDYHAEIITRLQNDCQELGLNQVHAITADICVPETISIAPQSCHKIICVRMLSIIDEQLAKTITFLETLLKDGGELIIIDGVHYKKDIEAELANTNRTYREISLVLDRTDHHFFSIAISSPAKK